MKEAYRLFVDGVESGTIYKEQTKAPGEERSWPQDSNELHVWMVYWFEGCMALFDDDIPPDNEQMYDMLHSGGLN